MVKNTMKVIKSVKESGIINPRYELYASNISEILSNSPNIFEAVANGFWLGYAQATKAARSELKKKERGI